MKRPLSLTIVSVAWFLLGLSGVIHEAVQGHRVAIPDANWISMLVGVGLLKEWQLARWYALLVTGISFFFVLVSTPWALMNASEMVYKFPANLMIDQRPHEPMALPVLIVAVTGLLVVSGWSFWVLSRRDVRELFATKAAAPRPVMAR